MNGASKNTNERGTSLVGSLVYVSGQESESGAALLRLKENPRELETYD